MLESLRRGQRWLTGILVAVIGLVFAAFIGLGGPLESGSGPAGTAVRVGELSYDERDYQRTRQRIEDALRERAGEQYNARQFAPIIDSQALNQLVESGILAESAREMGLRASKKEVQRVLTQDGGWRGEDGRFDREAFEGWVEWNYGTQQAFLEFMQQDLLRSKMVRLVYDQVEVSDAEAQQAALHGLEEVRIAYVSFDTEKLPSGAEISEEEIASYAAENEEALRAQYEESKSLFSEPARFNGRHILVSVDRDAPDEVVAEARARAEKAIARVEGGEAFAAVAKEISDDTSTAGSGGELAGITRGSLAPELEEAAFAQAIGTVSEDPIRSDKGFHVLTVESRNEERVQPYEDVIDNLVRPILVKQKASEHAETMTAKLEEAVKGGLSLEDAARAEGLDLGRSGLLKRRSDGFVPGLGGNQELLHEAFALTEAAPSSTRVFEVGSKRVMIQQLERKVPSQAELATAAEEQKGQLLTAKRSQALRSWIDTRRRMLEESGQLYIDPGLIRAS